MCICSWVYLFRMQGMLACLPSTVVSLFIVVHELCKQYTSSQECNPPHTRAAPTCETAFISQFLHTKQRVPYTDERVYSTYLQSNTNSNMA